jgi:hypothetical protein
MVISGELLKLSKGRGIVERVKMVVVVFRVGGLVLMNLKEGCLEKHVEGTWNKPNICLNSDEDCESLRY